MRVWIFGDGDNVKGVYARGPVWKRGQNSYSVYHHDTGRELCQVFPPTWRQLRWIIRHSHPTHKGMDTELLFWRWSTAVAYIEFLVPGRHMTEMTFQE